LYRISAPAPAYPESGCFFGDPAKSGSGQISSRICRFGGCQCSAVRVQLITDKTNEVDLSSGVFAILISFTGTKNTKFIAVPPISSKKLANSDNRGNTELYWLYIAVDSIADFTSFIRCIVLCSEKRIYPQIRFRLDLK